MDQLSEFEILDQWIECPSPNMDSIPQVHSSYSPRGSAGKVEWKIISRKSPSTKQVFWPEQHNRHHYHRHHLNHHNLHQHHLYHCLKLLHHLATLIHLLLLSLLLAHPTHNIHNLLFLKHNSHVFYLMTTVSPRE